VARKRNYVTANVVKSAAALRVGAKRVRLHAAGHIAFGVTSAEGDDFAKLSGVDHFMRQFQDRRDVS